MPVEISKLIGLVTTITNGVNEFRSVKGQAEINDAAMSVQAAVVDLQNGLLMWQTDYLAALQAKGDLENKLAALDSWNNEKSRYRLKHVGGSAYVYALVSKGENETMHWLCPNCFDNGGKSILQHHHLNTVWFCQRCAIKLNIGGEWP